MKNIYSFDGMFDASSKYRSNTITIGYLLRRAEEEDQAEREKSINYHISKKLTLAEKWERFVEKILGIN